jgi:hypothetical protein
MRAIPRAQLGFKTHAAAEPRDRGVCVSCGAHVRCTVGLATVSGWCTVCGGVAIKPAPADHYQRGAAPNISPSRPAIV